MVVSYFCRIIVENIKKSTMKTAEQMRIEKGQKYEDITAPFIKVIILKVLDEGMLLVNKTCTTSYGEVYLDYNTKIHSDNLRLVHRLITNKNK